LAAGFGVIPVAGQSDPVGVVSHGTEYLRTVKLPNLSLFKRPGLIYANERGTILIGCTVQHPASRAFSTDNAGISIVETHLV
jgi:hypothetical protein